MQYCSTATALRRIPNCLQQCVCLADPSKTLSLYSLDDTSLMMPRRTCCQLGRRHYEYHTCGPWSNDLNTQKLVPLAVGDQVRIQNQVGPNPRRWDKTRHVIEVRQHDQYVVQVDGSGRVTLRNRKFLEKYIPVQPPPLRRNILADLLHVNPTRSTYPTSSHRSIDGTPIPPEVPSSSDSPYTPFQERVPITSTRRTPLHDPECIMNRLHDTSSFIFRLLPISLVGHLRLH